MPICSCGRSRNRSATLHLRWILFKLNWFGLQQAAQRELAVLLLVFAAMCDRTKLAACQALEQGKILTAVQTPHTLV